jgi:two-component system phosphate regulon sensor histidine kinase PhoR
LSICLRLAAAAIPVAFVGWLFGDAAGALTGALLVLLMGFLYYAYMLTQLSRWLDRPEGSVPDGAGMWGDVMSKLYKLMRQERRTHQLLADTLARFQQAAEAMPDGAIMLDADNRIIWCNPTAERNLSITLARDRGLLLTNLLRNPALVAALKEQNYRDAISIKGHGSPDQALYVLLVPFGADQILLLARDVTHIEKMDTMRRDFIANVSHELRTPLTVLSGFVETLHRTNGGGGELFKKSLGHMEVQAARMQSLVEDLLTLSRLEDSRNPLLEQPINVPELVQSLLVDAEHLSGGKHTLRSRAGEFWVVGNRDELRSAFSNLVSNAVRYTPAGGTVEVIWEKAGEEPVFRVKDTGEGIASEHIPRLTERFYRVDRSRSRATGGTGLGLAIVKHVLNRHQAKLEVESELGKGSTFSVVFPVSRLAAPVATPRPAQAVVG